MEAERIAKAEQERVDEAKRRAKLESDAAAAAGTLLTHTRTHHTHDYALEFQPSTAALEAKAVADAVRADELAKSESNVIH